MKIPAQYRLTLLSLLFSALAVGILYLPLQVHAGYAALAAAIACVLAVRGAFVLWRQLKLNLPSAPTSPAPERPGAIGTVRTAAGLAFQARAYGIVGGVLHTDAGRFRRHERRPGVWVCVRDEGREFTFGTPPAA